MKDVLESLPEAALPVAAAHLPVEPRRAAGFSSRLIALATLVVVLSGLAVAIAVWFFVRSRARVAELLPRLPAVREPASKTAEPVVARPVSPSPSKAPVAVTPPTDSTVEPAPAPLLESPPDAAAAPGATGEPALPKAESEAEQLLRDAAEAMSSKQYSRAQTLIARMRRLGDSGGLKQALLPELYSLQGKLHESRQHYPEAMNEYMKYQKLPSALQKGKSAQDVKKAVARLSDKLGRIQVFTIEDGKCQLSDEIGRASCRERVSSPV